MLNISKKQDEEKLTIALDGRLDTTTAVDLERELKSGIDGVGELVFDMKDLAYISSAGLRVLLSAQKIMNKQGSMAVTNISDMVAEIFEVTGFADILTII